MWQVLASAIFIFSSVSGLTQPLPLADNVGFHKITDPSITAAVRAVAKSVYQIRVTNNYTAGGYRILDLSKATAIAQFNEILKDSSFDNYDRAVMNAIVNNCRKNNDTDCAIPTEVSRGTAFFLKTPGGNTVLMTNAHVVEPIWKAFKETSPSWGSEFLKNLDDDIFVDVGNFFLFNGEGQMIFSSLGNTVLIKRPAPSKSMFADKNDFYTFDNDYVRMSHIVDEELAFSKFSAIKLSAVSPKEGDEVFTVGFPYCTGCPVPVPTMDSSDFQTRGAGKDSDGRSLYISKGRVLSQEAQIKEFRKGLAGDIMASAYRGTNLFFYDADAMYGLSGAPVVNRLGEVIGITAGSTFFEDSGVLRRSTRGVILTDMFQQLPAQ